MLLVYRKEELAREAGKTIILINDLFFDTDTVLKNTDFTNIVLNTIDEASYHSPFTFIGRTKELGALNKNMLSTGTKTLLNIEGHPEKCFNVCECGNNALSLLPLLKNGCIFWENPAVAYDGAKECDILLDGVARYTDFYKFLEGVGDP